MQEKDILSFKIAKLNQVFYNKNSKHFSQTRLSPWLGWFEVVKHIKLKFSGSKKISILDIGSGNGRFADFLKTQFELEKFDYLGLDNSANLVKIAQEKLPDFKFLEYDITFQKLELLLHKQNFKPDIIVCFGLLHHLNSHSLNLFLQNIDAIFLAQNNTNQEKKSKSDDKLLVFTFWNFHTALSTKKLIQSLDSVEAKTYLNIFDIDSASFDKEIDFLLSWNGVSPYRYCAKHEEKSVLDYFKKSTSLNLKSSKVFLADGKNNTLNTYLLIDFV